MPSLGWLFVGGPLLVVGALVVWYARHIARFAEQIDAIGSTRDFGDVEPADWRVGWTAGGGLLLALAGGTVVVLGLAETLLALL